MRNLSCLLASIFLLALGACEKDSCEQTWTQEVMVPVTLNRQAVQDSIEAQGPREFCTGGNLYAYGPYLFVNVDRKGYHLLNNTDPSNPTPIAFLQIPGATYMAFVDGKMISDSYADLLVLDFQGPSALQLLSSSENFLLESQGFEVSQGEVAVAFEPQPVTFTQACDGSVTGGWNRGAAFFEADFSSFANGGGVGSTPSVNVAGSLARMAFCDKQLYVLGTDRLTTYTLSGDNLVERNNTSLGWGQETIIRRGDYLYVAGRSALLIFDVKDCGTPTQLGTAPHRWANDPVAVEGNIAVVTTRWGTANENPGGELLVFDVTDRTQPREIARHEATFPIGVALHEGTLYVCDGVDGLRIWNFGDGSPASFMEREVTGIDYPTTDVAVLPYASGTVVLTIGDDHLTQYEHRRGQSPAELVHLPVSPCAQR